MVVHARWDVIFADGRPPVTAVADKALYRAKAEGRGRVLLADSFVA